MREDIESNLDDHKYSLLAATGNAGTIIDEYDFYEEDYPNSDHLKEENDERLIIVKNEYQQKRKSKNHDNSLDLESETSLS